MGSGCYNHRGSLALCLGILRINLNCIPKLDPLKLSTWALLEQGLRALVLFCPSEAVPGAGGEGEEGGEVPSTWKSL